MSSTLLLCVWRKVGAMTSKSFHFSHVPPVPFPVGRPLVDRTLHKATRLFVKPAASTLLPSFAAAAGKLDISSSIYMCPRIETSCDDPRRRRRCVRQRRADRRRRRRSAKCENCESAQQKTACGPKCGSLCRRW